MGKVLRKYSTDWRLREWEDAAIIRIIHVGGYAEPLSEDELAETVARGA